MNDLLTFVASWSKQTMATDRVIHRQKRVRITEELKTEFHGFTL